MRLPSWLRPLVTHPNRNPVRRSSKRPTFRPRVETLEDRTTPSGGVLDSTFGTGGSVTLSTATSDYVAGSVVQPDGKIVSVGAIALKTSTNSANNTTQVSVTRLNANGTLDASFGSGGLVKLPVGVTSFGTSIALQPDGKIVVSAGAFTANTYDAGEFAVARLNANGTLDTTFGNNRGWWLFDPTSKREVLEKIAIAPSGSGFSIVVAGEGSLANGTPEFAAVRLTSAGQPDATFGTNGVAQLSLGDGGNSTYGMTVTPSGGVAVVGNVHIGRSYGCVVNWDATGHLNTAFNGTGYVLDALGGPSGNGSYYGIAAQGADLIAIGSFSAGPGLPLQGVIGRYTSSGSIDPAFATNGHFVTASDATHKTGFAKGSDVKLEADGSLIVLGSAAYTDAGGTSHSGLLLGHLSADGVADATFGTAGTGFTTQYDIEPSGLLLSLALDPSGNIIVGTRHHLLRFTGP